MENAKISAELEAAKTARADGNEGKARVCARRAAGIAIGEYLRERGLPDPGPGAYDRIRFLAAHPEVAPRLREIANHLILRVDEEFQLPDQIDLIAEAQELAYKLSSVTLE